MWYQLTDFILKCILKCNNYHGKCEPSNKNYVHNTSGSGISSLVKNLVSLKDVPEYQEITPKKLDKPLRS